VRIASTSAEDFGIDKSTAWDYAPGTAELLAQVIGCPAADLKGQLAGKLWLVDGTLIPTCNWCLSFPP